MSLFQFIKNTVSIADLVGEYVSLRSIGTYLKGCCPFHSEKTASFKYDRFRNKWYLFSEAVGGNNTDFIQLIGH